jgi:hypothetical protein
MVCHDRAIEWDAHPRRARRARRRSNTDVMRRVPCANGWLVDACRGDSSSQRSSPERSLGSRSTRNVLARKTVLMDRSPGPPLLATATAGSSARAPLRPPTRPELPPQPLATRLSPEGAAAGPNGARARPTARTTASPITRMGNLGGRWLTVSLAARHDAHHLPSRGRLPTAIHRRLC